MLVRKYEAENGSAAMLATHTAGVAPEVNLDDVYTLLMPPPGVNKAAYSGFEAQRRRHQKSKIGVSVAPQKSTDILQKMLKKL